MKAPDRPLKAEIMDQLPATYTAEEFTQCLHQLRRIGHHLGAERHTLQAFRNLATSPESILDVGCGGGHFTARLAETFPNASVTGIDFNAEAVHFARQQHQRPNLAFKNVDQKELQAEKHSVDVVTATLVCHHMSNPEIIDFLQRARKAARQAVILNDLHLHPLALGGFYIASRILYHNRLIIADGQLSIQKAFRRDDWSYYLHEAGIQEEQAHIRWCWPFRWLIILQAAE
jgi:2-polyprenyl-3-methyl-5-hydroxy-6-metoxy-1,4-benzoquinol methylase